MTSQTNMKSRSEALVIGCNSNSKSFGVNTIAESQGNYIMYSSFLYVSKKGQIYLWYFGFNKQKLYLLV